MITTEQFETGTIAPTDEWFDPIYRPAYWHGVPFKRLVGFQGCETGTLLHPEFSDVLEPT